MRGVGISVMWPNVGPDAYDSRHKQAVSMRLNMRAIIRPFQAARTARGFVVAPFLLNFRLWAAEWSCRHSRRCARRRRQRPWVHRTRISRDSADLCERRLRHARLDSAAFTGGDPADVADADVADLAQPSLVIVCWACQPEPRPKGRAYESSDGAGRPTRHCTSTPAGSLRD